MTTLRLRYVQMVVRGGRRFHYFRRPGFPRVTLPGLPGSVAFMQAYQRALDAAPEPIGIGRHAPGSMAALALSYFQSPAFKALRPTSQSTYRNTIERFNVKHGHKLVRDLQPRHVADLIHGMSDRPGAANHMLKALRVLMQHAFDRRLIEVNPTIGIKKLRYVKKPYATWLPEHVEQFKAHWPMGTQARLAIVLLTCTGARRSDAIRLGPGNVRNGYLEYRQQKTGRELSIPIREELREAIEAVPVQSVEAFLLTAHGRPFASPTAFYNRFMRWAADAGIPAGLSPHGLRKAAAVELAHAGCSHDEIMSITGHDSPTMVSVYTKGADQRRLATAATARLERARKGEK